MMQLSTHIGAGHLTLEYLVRSLGETIAGMGVSYRMPNIKEIEEKALKLPSNEQALLAERLINSLEDKEDTEAERLWVEEAERRYRKYKEGKVKASPAVEVFIEADDCPTGAGRAVLLYINYILDTVVCSGI